jgi:hypothetical protein
MTWWCHPSALVWSAVGFLSEGLDHMQLPSWLYQCLEVLFINFIVGYVIVAGILHFLRWRLQHPDKANELDFWLGGTERTVATALVIWAPGYVGPFIGAWVALKMAANWQRLKSQSAAVRQGTLLALLGNAFSFTIAIGVGVYFNRHALEVWAK